MNRKKEKLTDEELLELAGTVSAHSRILTIILSVLDVDTLLKVKEKILLEAKNI